MTLPRMFSRPSTRTARCFCGVTARTGDRSCHGAFRIGQYCPFGPRRGVMHPPEASPPIHPVPVMKFDAFLRAPRHRVYTPNRRLTTAEDDSGDRFRP